MLAFVVRRLLQAAAVMLVVAFIAFAVVNRDPVQVDFPFVRLDITAPLFLVMAGVYGLGMLTGWSVVGFVQKSIRRASEHRDR